MHTGYTEAPVEVKYDTSCRPWENQQVNYWFGNPRIISNPTGGYQVIGGIWFRNRYPNLKDAQKELDRREKELAQRKAAGIDDKRDLEKFNAN